MKESGKISFDFLEENDIDISTICLIIFVVLWWYIHVRVCDEAELAKNNTSYKNAYVRICLKDKPNYNKKDCEAAYRIGVKLKGVSWCNK